MAKLTQIQVGTSTYDLGAAWGNISGKPSTFAPSAHNHNQLVNTDAAGTLTWSGDHFISSVNRPTAKLHFGSDQLYFYNGTYYALIHAGNIGNQSVNYANSAGVATRSQKLETWYSDKSKTYGENYPLYAWWETGSICRLTVDNYTVKVNQADSADKLTTARSIQTNLASTNAANFDGSGNITPGVTGTLPIANGGTTATTAVGARVNLMGIGSNPISSTTNDTVANWGMYGPNAIAFFSVTGRLINQPQQYGFVANIQHATGQELHQLWFGQPSADIYHRGGNGSGWGSNWKKLLDSSNYTEYTVTKTGSGASGTWGINITGSAGSVAWGNVTGKPSLMASQPGYIEMFPGSSAGHGGYIDFHYNSSNVDHTSRIIESSSGTISINGHAFTTSQLTLNGNIGYTNGSYTDYPVIRFTTGTNDGCGITIGGGGFVAIGSGESANNLITALGTAGNTEDTHITGDGVIYFHTNCQTIANRKTTSINASGHFSGSAESATNADKVDGYHATSFGINYNSGDVDINTCTQSGFYRFGGSPKNAFTNAAWGQMLVVHGAGDTICQVGMPYNERAIYIRQGNPSNVGGSGSYQAWKRLWGAGDSVTGAVWNDYAECRESDCEEFGYVLMETGNDSLTKTTERLSHFAGISSDTWGFSQGETEKAKTPIAVAGRVLAYTYQNRNNYKPGDCVCAAPGGTVDIMTREEIINWPDRIVGTVSCVPDYEEWGGEDDTLRQAVKVNGRIWIKVK